MLLPDGRVLTFGGNPLNQPFEMTIGIFSPGYMTKTRPTITSSPTEITWGTPFPVTHTPPTVMEQTTKPKAA